MQCEQDKTKGYSNAHIQRHSLYTTHTHSLTWLFV